MNMRNLESGFVERLGEMEKRMRENEGKL